MDKITNIYPTNNNYLIECTCHFWIRLQLSNGIGAVFKENRQTKSCLTIKASFIITVPALTRGQLYTGIQKTVGDKVTTHGTWQETVLSVQVFN